MFGTGLLREREAGGGKLDLAARSGGQLAHLHHQTRTLHRIELEDVGRYLGDERVGGEGGNLVFARAAVSAEQVGDCDFQCAR
jgi:hypothetical protein